MKKDKEMPKRQLLPRLRVTMIAAWHWLRENQLRFWAAMSTVWQRLLVFPRLLWRRAIAAWQLLPTLRISLEIILGIYLGLLLFLFLASLVRGQPVLTNLTSYATFLGFCGVLVLDVLVIDCFLENIKPLYRYERPKPFIKWRRDLRGALFIASIIWAVVGNYVVSDLLVNSLLGWVGDIQKRPYMPTGGALAPGETVIVQGTICILVYYDEDNSCVWSEGEDTLQGAVISLTDGNGTLIGTYTTRFGNQPYCFVGLAPDIYMVKEEREPPGYLLSRIGVYGPSVPPEVATREWYLSRCQYSPQSVSVQIGLLAGDSKIVEFGHQIFYITMPTLASPTPTLTPTPTSIATPMATETPTPMNTPTPTATYTSTPMPTTPIPTSLTPMSMTLTPVPTYIVQEGETLAYIAKKCNTTVETILALNPQITNHNLIQIGERLIVPLGASTPPEPTATHTPIPTPTNTAIPAATPTATFMPTATALASPTVTPLQATPTLVPPTSTPTRFVPTRAYTPVPEPKPPPAPLSPRTPTVDLLIANALILSSFLGLKNSRRVGK